MRKFITNIVLFFLLLCTLSCSRLEKTITNDIKVNAEKYEELVETVYSCDFSRFKYGQYISKQYFPKKLDSVLTLTRLKYSAKYIILYKKGIGCEQLSFDIISGKYGIHYEPCPKSNFPEPDSYLKEGLYETWGVNDKWMIWKDSDVVF